MNGAMAAPRKRRKLYAADAVERSTGAASMTAVVMSVLLFPSTAPAKMTQTMTTAGVSVKIPINRSKIANMINIMTIALIVPNHCFSFGAVKTDVIASNIPQPRKTNPSPCAGSFMTNGA